MLTYYLTNTTATSPPTNYPANIAYVLSTSTSTPANLNISVPNQSTYSVGFQITTGSILIKDLSTIKTYLNVTTASADIQYRTQVMQRYSSTNTFLQWVHSIYPDPSLYYQTLGSVGTYEITHTSFDDNTFASTNKLWVVIQFYSSRAHSGPSSINLSVNGSASYITIEDPPSTGSNIHVWNGSSWVPKPLKRWNGSEWVSATLKRWNGSDWITE